MSLGEHKVLETELKFGKLCPRLRSFEAKGKRLSSHLRKLPSSCKNDSGYSCFFFLVTFPYPALDLYPTNLARQTGSPRKALPISVDFSPPRTLGRSLQLHTAQGPCPPPVLFFLAVLQSQFTNPASHPLNKVCAF